MENGWKAGWQSRRPVVGFIGLGIMGRPMARHVMQAGYPLVAYNRSPGRTEEFVAAGARSAASPGEVAELSDIVITIVTDSPDVEEVLLGDAGVIHHARPGSVVIDMSTISPDVTRTIAKQLNARGIAMLDAPVTGGDTGAQAGTLSIMVGGDESVFNACHDVLATMGTNIVYVGPQGMGQTVKLCNQVLCGLHALAAAEALTLAAKAGADPDKVLSVVTKGAAGSWALENLGPKMVSRDFAPGFMVKLLQKDLRLALEAAEKLEVALPGAALVQQLYRTVQALGGGDEGTQAIIKTLELLGQSELSSNEPKERRLSG